MSPIYSEVVKEKADIHTKPDCAFWHRLEPLKRVKLEQLRSPRIKTGAVPIEIRSYELAKMEFYLVIGFEYF